MDALKSDNEKLLAEARKERDRLLKEASEMKDSIIAQAKKSADDEARRLIANANDAIEKAKLNAMNELKSQVAVLSVDMAEKILRKKMDDRNQQEAFVNENLKSITLN
jgi:F-type H+-transporting ATPase subunit b